MWTPFFDLLLDFRPGFDFNKFIFGDLPQSQIWGPFTIWYITSCGWHEDSCLFPTGHRECYDRSQVAFLGIVLVDKLSQEGHTTYPGRTLWLQEVPMKFRIFLTSFPLGPPYPQNPSWPGIQVMTSTMMMDFLEWPKWFWYPDSGEWLAL